MKRLDRYVLGLFVSGWSVATVFFVGMYMLIHFFNKAARLSNAVESFNANGMSAFVGFARYYGYNIPFILVMSAPFTVLMGAMWAAQHMARRNELVPTLISGVSFRRLSTPLLVAGFLIALCYTGVKEEVLPAIAGERHRMERIFRGRTQEVLQRLHLIRDGRGNEIYIRSYELIQQVATDVYVIPSGDGRAHWRLGAMAFQEDGAQGAGWYPVPGTETKGEFPLPIPTDLRPLDLEIETRALLYLDVGDLKRMIKRYPNRGELSLLLHDQYAYPLSVVVLMLMGLPLVLRMTRRSAFVAVGTSLLLSIAFLAVQRILHHLGAEGQVLNPLLGAWLPIILFGALGILLFETMAT